MTETDEVRESTNQTKIVMNELIQELKIEHKFKRIEILGKLLSHTNAGFDFIQMILENSEFPLIIDLIVNQHESVKLAAMQFLTALTERGSSKQIEILLDKGLINCLDISIDHAPIHYRLSAIECLNNIAQSSTQNAQCLITTGLLNCIEKGFYFDNEALSRQTIFLICNLIKAANINHVKMMYITNITTPLYKHISSQDIEMKQVIQEGLKILLKKSNNFLQYLGTKRMQ